MRELSQEYLNYLFSYDEFTGILTRKISRCNAVKVGDSVGCVCVDGYLRVRIDKDLHLVHRVIWVLFHGIQPINHIDHISGITDDNSILNLRDVTREVNSKNTRIKSNNKSGVSGVFWRKEKQKYQVKIYINGNNIVLGSFDNIFDAACVRFSANNKYKCTKRHGRIG